METAIFEKYFDIAEEADLIKCTGKITKVQGLLIESRGPQAIIGELCTIEAPQSEAGQGGSSSTPK